MSEHLGKVRQFAATADAAAVEQIVKYCGIALRNTDSSLVASSDPEELARVRDGFAAKKLGLDPEAATKGIEVVVQKMKGEPRKDRVTFYYLLAEATGTLDKLK